MDKSQPLRALTDIGITPPVLHVIMVAAQGFLLILAVALSALATPLQRPVVVLLVRLLGIPGALALVVAVAEAMGATGLWLFIGVGLNVHAGIPRLSVGRIAAALRLRIKGVLTGKASGSEV